VAGQRARNEETMQYALLIYSAEDAGPQEPAEFEAEMQGYFTFNEEAGERILGGEPLEAVATATTVRVRDGESLVTDGPFAETKEVLGGFYLLDCENIDEALMWAAKIPAAKHGSIEVRPVMPIPGA